MKIDSTDKVAVFGHFGRGNLGDEATLAEVIRNIEIRQPEAKILALTINTEDARTRHGVEAIPIRRLPKTTAESTSESRAQASTDTESDQPAAKSASLKQFVKSIPLVAPLLRGTRDALQSLVSMMAEIRFLAASYGPLRGTKMMIVAGGGQLGDYFEGAWGYPYTIWKWVILARWRGAEVVFLSCGAGPITTSLGTRFLRWGLSRSSYRSFRDDHSRQLIEGIGLQDDNFVFPDMVHGTPLPLDLRKAEIPFRTVGINPLPYHDPRYWAVDDSRVYETYVNSHVEFVLYLLDRGINVLLFPTQMRADPPVIRDILSEVEGRGGLEKSGTISQAEVNSFEELFQAISQTDAIVASRFHGIVFSLLTRRPTLGLSYDPKSRALMEDVGLGEFVQEIGEVDSDWLVSRFEKLCDQAAEIGEKIEAAESEYSKALVEQYDRLLADTQIDQNAGVEGVEHEVQIPV